MSLRWHLLSVPLSPSRQDQIKSTWGRCTKPVFIQASLFLSVSVSLSFILFSPLWFSLEKTERLRERERKKKKNQGQATKHVELRENKFPHTCPFRPTDSLEECSLVKPGNIWLVKTYGMFACAPPLLSTFSFLSPFGSPLTQDTPDPYSKRRVGGCLIHESKASPHCQCLSRGESN